MGLLSLRLEPFRRAHFAEYASWFADAALQHHLGPMDEEWLDAVLSEPADAGRTLVAFDGAAMVAVVELALGVTEQPVVIRAIAVRPDRRGRGYGRAALRVIEQLPGVARRPGLRAHVAEENTAASALFAASGFVCESPLADAHGYCTWQREVRDTASLDDVR